MLNFLPRKIHIISIIAIIVTYLFGEQFLAFVIFTIYSFLFYLFRTSIHKSEKISGATGRLVYAPVNGKIIGVANDVTHPNLVGNVKEIRIMIPWNMEYGVYFPQKVEITDVKNLKGRSLNRHSRRKWRINLANKYAGVFVKMKNRNDEEIAFQVIPPRWGFIPKFWLIPGDRASDRVLGGYLPFGGTLLLYLPQSYEILINRGVFCEARETLLAGEKG